MLIGVAAIVFGGFLIVQPKRGARAFLFMFKLNPRFSEIPPDQQAMRPIFTIVIGVFYFCVGLVLLVASF